MQENEDEEEEEEGGEEQGKKKSKRKTGEKGGRGEAWEPRGLGDSGGRSVLGVLHQLHTACTRTLPMPKGVGLRGGLDARQLSCPSSAATNMQKEKNRHNLALALRTECYNMTQPCRDA
jgi:hypothetical protein